MWCLSWGKTRDCRGVVWEPRRTTAWGVGYGLWKTTALVREQAHFASSTINQPFLLFEPHLDRPPSDEVRQNHRDRNKFLANSVHNTVSLLSEMVRSALLRQPDDNYKRNHTDEYQSQGEELLTFADEHVLKLGLGWNGMKQIVQRVVGSGNNKNPEFLFVCLFFGCILLLLFLFTVYFPPFLTPT